MMKKGALAGSHSSSRQAGRQEKKLTNHGPLSPRVEREQKKPISNTHIYTHTYITSPTRHHHHHRRRTSLGVQCVCTSKRRAQVLQARVMRDKGPLLVRPIRLPTTGTWAYIHRKTLDCTQAKSLLSPSLSLG